MSAVEQKFPKVGVIDPTIKVRHRAYSSQTRIINSLHLRYPL
ncbi:MAG: hypothetical protein ACXAC5_03560 [Promethearchaeota archaeon]